MKTYILLPSLLLLAACGGEQGDAASSAEETQATAAEATAAPAAGQAPIASLKALPWGFSHMPAARYIHSIDNFSRPRKKHGGEATALIALKGTPQQIVDYYDGVAKENGFTTNVGNQQDEATAKLEAKKDSGETFHVFAARGGSKAEEGESSATLVFQKAPES